MEEEKIKTSNIIKPKETLIIANCSSNKQSNHNKNNNTNNSNDKSINNNKKEDEKITTAVMKVLQQYDWTLVQAGTK